MKLASSTSRKLRSLREFVRGLTDTAHPLLVQIIPIRRCNIDCGYCNEYDKVSPPVPTEVMLRRIDKLAELGTSVVAFSGGEPMLHPDLDDLIRRIRGRGMMAGLITNGYYLVPQRIEALNRAGLDFLQISIDNVEPDEVSKKSLRVLDKKLTSKGDRGIVSVETKGINQRGEEVCYFTRKVMVWTEAAAPGRERPYESAFPFAPPPLVRPSTPRRKRSRIVNDAPAQMPRRKVSSNCVTGLTKSR